MELAFANGSRAWEAESQERELYTAPVGTAKPSIRSSSAVYPADHVQRRTIILEEALSARREWLLDDMAARIKLINQANEEPDLMERTNLEEPTVKNVDGDHFATAGWIFSSVAFACVFVVLLEFSSGQLTFSFGGIFGLAIFALLALASFKAHFDVPK